MYDIAIRLAGVKQTDDLQVQKNLPAAVELFQRLIIEQGHVDSMFQLAKILVHGGKGVSSDSLQACRLFQCCITEANDPNAMYQLARVLAGINTHTPINVPRAVDLYQRCIDACNATSAMYELAGILITGAPGVTMDVYRAVRFYQRCIEENHLGAMFDLAKLLVAGNQYIERDVSRALQLVQSYVTAEGNVYEVVSLSETIARGTANMVKDEPLAIRLLEICIEVQSDARAMLVLAEILFSGFRNREADCQRACRLFKRSLTRGASAHLAYNIIRQIARGSQEIAKNLPLAAKLCQMCIDNKTVEGALVLQAEILLSDASGIPRDSERAVRLCKTYLTLSKFCYPVTRLAEKLAYGTSGIAPDWRVALQILELSIIRRSDGEAIKLLGEMLSDEWPDFERDLDKDMQLFQTAANNGDIYAACELPSLARKVAKGSPLLDQNLPLGAKLCDICIKKKIDSEALVVLAEIFALECKQVVRRFERIVQLCRQYIDLNSNCSPVTRLAENIARGTSGMIKNAPVAAQLLQICIDKRDDVQAMVMIAELVITEFPPGHKNAEIALSACEHSLNGGIHSSKVLRLAKGIGKGTLGHGRNIPFAMRLYEMCIAKSNSPDAIVALMEALVAGPTDVDKDIQRAVKLCERYVNENRSLDAILLLAGKLARGTALVTKDVSCAVRLLEVCIKGREDPKSMLTLAEILVDGTTNVKRDIDRVVELCANAIERSATCMHVLLLAKRIANGLTWTATNHACCAKKKGKSRPNAALAVVLVEICIARRNEADSVITLAEILISGAPDDDRDIGRAVQLCEHLVVADRRYCVGVADLARRVARGSEFMASNVPLAIRLCQICMADGKDADSMAVLVEIMALGSGDVRRDICRAAQLCEMMIEEGWCEEVVGLARRIAHGVTGFERDLMLALQLCAMCVERCDDRRAVLFLLEMERDMTGAAEMYQRALEGF